MMVCMLGFGRNVFDGLFKGFFLWEQDVGWKFGGFGVVEQFGL